MTVALTSIEVGSSSSSSPSEDVGTSGVPVRRPMRGLLLKEEVYATLSVKSAGNVTLKNSSVAGDPVFTTNFLLQSVTETRNEKAQFVTTFGSTYAFFFGEQPRIINCAAVLLNTPDFDWEREWLENYQTSLRGSSLTARNAKALLRFDGQTIVGYIINCTTIKAAQDPNLVNMNFSMFVESIEYDGDIGTTEVYGEGPESRARELGVDGLAGRTVAESTTAAVRRANIKLQALTSASNTLGFVGASLARLRGGSIDSAIDANIRAARNLLYGRNLVVSRSFISSAGNTPIFPEGTGAEALTTSSSPSSIILRTTTDFIGEEEARDSKTSRSHTYDNVDEYLGGRVYQVEDVGGEINAPDGFIVNDEQIRAFSAFGLADKIQVYAGTRDADTAVAAYSAAKAQGFAADILRSASRAAFEVLTYQYGTSRVNQRRELQSSITNPNTGGLSANVRADLEADIQATTRTAEQDRLVAEAEADRLRGNTGTVTPGSPLTILGGILTSGT